MYKKRKRTLKNMKYPLLTKSAFLLFAAGAMAGCSDSEEGLLPSSRPAKPGETILFGIDGPATTRTHYTEDSLQIDWDLKDKIVIYSPEAEAATPDGIKHHAFYMINNVYPEDDPIHQFHGDFVPIEKKEDGSFTEEPNYGVGLKWTEGDGPNGFAHEAYTFYGAYPAQRVIDPENINGGRFTMKHITNQIDTVISVNDGVHNTRPDMLNAYMMAKKVVQPQKDHVLLSFDPIMTTLDINVTAGGFEVPTGIMQKQIITGVSIISNGVLGENWTYNASNGTTGNKGDGTYPTTGGENGGLIYNPNNGTESVFVGVYYNGKRYVDLGERETLRLTAFLPPKQMGSGTIIKVHTPGNFDYTFALKEGQNYFKEQSRIDIQLPDVSLNTLRPNNWISPLDGNIPFKQLSIPGYECTGNETGTDIQNLLNKGIRAFDMNALFKKSNEHTLYDDFTIEDATITETLQKFIDNNPKEFVIIWLENYERRKQYDIYLDNAFRTSWTDKLPETVSVGRNKRLIAIKHFKGVRGDDFNKANDLIIGGAAGREILFYGSVISTGWNKDPEVNEFINNIGKEWKAWYIEDEGEEHNNIYNQLLYEGISTFTQPKGYTGIVIVPNADQTYVNGEYTYSDLLIQSIIDCNFKFILDRAN